MQFITYVILYFPSVQDIVPYVVKKSKSCAPEDGQKFDRNMLSCSWRSIKLLLLHLVGVPYLLYLHKALFCWVIQIVIRSLNSRWRMQLTVLKDNTHNFVSLDHKVMKWLNVIILKMFEGDLPDKQAPFWLTFLDNNMTSHTMLLP
jgi:hypothetical protein